MNPPHLLIIGCGDIGGRLASLLVPRGWHISALRRDPRHLPKGITGYKGTYTEAAGLNVIKELRPDYCLFTPVPDGRDKAGYERGFRDSVDHIVATGVLESVRRNFYVSSTRVYAENAGGWVTEAAPLTTSDPQGVAITQGEARARCAAPTTVVRPAGIYGALPGMLIERVAAGAGSAAPERMSNRVHRDDVAGLLAHLLEAAEAGVVLPDSVNAVDDQPAPIGQVESWLAEQLGVKLVARRSNGGRVVANRRISNRLLRELGYSLIHPDWRSGYTAMLASWRER